MERVWSRLEQRIEVGASRRCKRVGRGGQIDRLAGEHIHSARRRPDPLELWEMGVEIQGRDTPHQAEDVALDIDVDRGRGAVRRRGGAQAEMVLDRHAQPGQQTPGIAAEALPWGIARSP